MGKKDTGQSVSDIAVEVADEMGDIDLQESTRQLKDHKSLQVARAKAVIQALTSGLPDKPTQDDGIDYLDYLTDRLNKVITVNLDADSIYEFLSLCGVRMADLRSSFKGRERANKRHSQPGGSRDKKAAILAIWASGKYWERDVCAEEECAGLGLSFSKTRKHLIGTPDNPKPKPLKA